MRELRLGQGDAESISPHNLVALQSLPTAEFEMLKNDLDLEATSGPD